MKFFGKKGKKSFFKNLMKKRGEDSRRSVGYTLDTHLHWRIALSVLIIAAVLALALAVLLFRHIGGQTVIGFSGSDNTEVEGIDRSALQETISHYEDKERAFESLVTAPILIPEPVSSSVFSANDSEIEAVPEESPEDEPDAEGAPQATTTSSQ